MRNSIGFLLGALGARGGAALGGMLFSLLVARTAGAEGLGQFAVFTALLGTLSLLALHGADTAIVRTVAWADAQGKTGSAIGILWHSAMTVLLMAVGLGVIGSWILASELLGTPFPGAVALMPVALVIQSALALAAGYAKGRSRPWLAPTFEIGGVSFFAAFFLFMLSDTPFILEGIGVMGTFIAALGLSATTASVMILLDRRENPQWRADKQQKADMRSGRIDFTLIGAATFVAQAGSFLLAAPFLSESDLGLLRAAERLAIVVSFSVLVIDPIIAPRIVKLSRAGEHKRLDWTIVRSMLLSAAIASPILVLLLIWPGTILRLMGPDFISAGVHLRIMALTHFVTAILGPLSMVLNMTYRERKSMWVSLMTMGLAVTAIPALSYFYGANGFVAAYCGIILLRLSIIGILVLTTDPPIHAHTSRDRGR